MYLENAPDGIYISDLKGKFLYGNKKAEEITGYRREELINKSYLELKLLPGKYLLKALNLLALNAVGKPTGPDEFLFTKSDGTRIWVEINTMPFHQERQTHVLAFARDITERKRMEAALKESEEKFSKAFRSSPEAIIISRLSDGIIVDVNDTFPRLTGYTREEMLGNTTTGIGIWVNPEERAAMAKELKQKLTIRDKEYKFRTKSGKTRIWLFSGEIATINGESCIISVSTDITERKQMEEKLRHLDEMKSEFLSNVAHELRTPLQSIGGFTKLIMAGQVPDPATQQEFLQIIDDETTHLGNLINSLLDLSRMDSGLLNLEKTVTDLNQLVESVVAEASIRADQYHFIAKTGQQPLKIEIDARRIRQVLDNLVDNAVKYSPPGTKITITASKLNQEALVIVTDQGPGIPEGELKNIFERMYRIEQRPYTGADGVGLGLYICEQLVKAHGGHIWAESEQGKGSSFKFTLPLTSVTKKNRKLVYAMPAK